MDFSIANFPVMQVHILQMDIIWRDKTANFENLERMLGQVSLEKGDLILLPEMFATGFDVEFGGLAEGQKGELEETAHFLGKISRELGVFVQGTGISKGKNALRRNMVVVFDPKGNQLANFTKLHPFTYGGEHKRFEAGEGVVVWPWHKWKVAPFLCYDLRFPEAFRLAVRRGAEILVVPANWPSPRHSHWLALLQARAIENQAYVVGVNRCGRDKFLEYNGESVVYDPKGNEVLRAGALPGIFSFLPHREILEKWRREFPVLQDMREEFFGENQGETSAT